MSLGPPRGTASVVQQLVDLLRAPHGELPQIDPIAPRPPPRRVVAVDGSSVVLAEAGDRSLVAYRAGSVGVQEGRPTPARVPPPELVLIGPDARELLAERLEAHALSNEGLPRLDVASALDALRTLAEIEEAAAALETLERGDLLLMDGALQTRPAVPLLPRVLARAAKRGVDVVGVCKSTSMTIGGAPALVACQLAARGRHAQWLAPLPPAARVEARSFAARLSPAEPRPFRFDVASPRDPGEVLGAIASLCGHPAYPGYPSPLAMAHNAVLLNEEARRRLLATVQEGVLKAGVDADAWDAAFVDYHDILEIGA